MQYSPKLKNAAEEIKEILNRYDIAASVVMHTPGFSEYILKIDPSYSCAKIEGNAVRVKANLKNDFAGDKQEMSIVLANTSNMLNLLATTSGQNALQLFTVSKMVDKQTNAKHTGGDHSSHSEQNN